MSTRLDCIRNYWVLYRIPPPVNGRHNVKLRGRANTLQICGAATIVTGRPILIQSDSIHVPSSLLAHGSMQTASKVCP